MACWADTRRSHSRASAVARYGLEEGICKVDLVVGLRTIRVSRLTVNLPSTRSSID